MAFLNSDLLGMTLSLHMESELFPNVSSSTVTGFNPAYPWNALPMYDIQILFGGEVVYKAPGYSSRLIGQEPTISSVYLNNTIVQLNPALTNPATSVSRGNIRSFITFIDMSRLRSFLNSSTFFNTIKLPQQVLQISFSVPSYYAANQAAGSGTPDILPTPIFGNMSLHACYYYPQVTEINSSGSVNIFYN